MHKYISVAYKLYSVENGSTTLEEEATAEYPFQFLSGFGVSLEAFEKKIVELNSGDDFDFTLTKEEAFGEFDASHVLDLDREMFTINGHFDHERIFEGAFVPMRNNDGNTFHARVLEITDDTVKMDFNPPLAGKELQFVGKVLENREATEKEIQGMIARLSGGGCSCGCGSCGDGCEGGCGGHDHECGCDDHNHSCGCGCH